MRSMHIHTPAVSDARHFSASALRRAPQPLASRFPLTVNRTVRHGISYVGHGQRSCCGEAFSRTSSEEKRCPLSVGGFHCSYTSLVILEHAYTRSCSFVFTFLRRFSLGRTPTMTYSRVCRTRSRTMPMANGFPRSTGTLKWLISCSMSFMGVLGVEAGSIELVSKGWICRFL